jgi:type IX secretion system PorP/SprF family membrane protein
MIEKMTYKTLILLTLVLGFKNSEAQFFQQSSLYSENLYLINPASIGDYDYLRSSFSHRNQWTGIKGAPRSNAYTLSTPVSGNIFLGGIFLSDKEDLIERTSAMLTYAYRLQLDKTQTLFFAVSAGMGQTKLNLQDARVDDFTDNVLNFQQNNSTAFSANFGAFYTWGKLNVGLAFPNFAKVNAGAVQFGDSGLKGLKESPLAHASYHFDNISSNIGFTPSFVYRFAPVDRSQYDAMLKVDFKNRFWGGMMFRQYAGVIAMAGANLTDQLQVGYSYEMPTSGIAMQTSGSHEFMVSLNLRAISAGLKRENYKHAKRFLPELSPLDSSLTGPTLPDYLGAEKETISVIDAIRKYREDRKRRRELGTFKKFDEKGFVGGEAKKGYYVILAAHRTKKMAILKATLLGEKGVNVQVILNDRKSWYLITGNYTQNREQAIIKALFFRKSGYKGTWVFINK